MQTFSWNYHSCDLLFMKLSITVKFYLFIYLFIYSIFTALDKRYCSGERLEGNIQTIRASPPRNYNRHLNKQTKQNYNSQNYNSFWFQRWEIPLRYLQERGYTCWFSVRMQGRHFYLKICRLPVITNRKNKIIVCKDINNYLWPKLKYGDGERWSAL